MAASASPIVVDGHYIKKVEFVCGKTHFKLDHNHKSRPHLMKKIPRMIM